MTAKLGKDNLNIILAWHGTSKKNIESIIENNFGFDNIDSNKYDIMKYLPVSNDNDNDNGNKNPFGICFSEFANLGCEKDNTGLHQLLLCKVILGKQYKIEKNQILILILIMVQEIRIKTRIKIKIKKKIVEKLFPKDMIQLLLQMEHKHTDKKLLYLIKIKYYLAILFTTNELVLVNVFFRPPLKLVQKGGTGEKRWSRWYRCMLSWLISTLIQFCNYVCIGWLMLGRYCL